MLNAARYDKRCGSVCDSARRGGKAHAFRETGHSLCKTSPESAQTAGGSAAEKRASDASLTIIHQKKDVCQYRRRRIFPFGESGNVFSVCEARAAGRSASRIITPRTVIGGRSSAPASADITYAESAPPLRRGFVSAAGKSAAGRRGLHSFPRIPRRADMAGAPTKIKHRFNWQVFLTFAFQITLSKQRNSLRQAAGHCENGYFRSFVFILRCFSNGIRFRSGGGYSVTAAVLQHRHRSAHRLHSGGAAGKNTL